jgi:hypothetical protein
MPGETIEAKLSWTLGAFKSRSETVTADMSKGDDMLTTYRESRLAIYSAKVIGWGW